MTEARPPTFRRFRASRIAAMRAGSAVERRRYEAAQALFAAYGAAMQALSLHPLAWGEFDDWMRDIAIREADARAPSEITEAAIAAAYRLSLRPEPSAGA